MNFKQTISGCNFYIPENADSNKGFLALVLPGSVESPGSSIPFKDALTKSDLSGSFIFSAQTPSVSTEDEVNSFLEVIYKEILKSARGVVWLLDPNNINSSTASLLGLNADGSAVNSGLQAPLVGSELTFLIANGMPVSLPDGSSTLNLGSSQTPQAFSFGGPGAPTMTQSTQGTLDFAGDQTGCVKFQTYINRQSLNDDLKWGFQFLFPLETNGNSTNLSEWIPLADGSVPSGSDRIKFNISIDPSDPFNDTFTGETVAEKYGARRTYFDFVGINFDKSKTELSSYYKTVFGHTLNLVPIVSSDGGALPARMVISLGEQTSSSVQNFHLAPEGDYLLQNGSSADGSQVNMICGLQGTEFFTVMTANASGEGDKIRFLSRNPAYSNKFPFKPTSPVAAPPVLDPNIIDETYTTSWATILQGGSQQVTYVAQPKGSALFGTDSIQGSDSPVYGHTAPGFEFDTTQNIFFPMLPYSGMSVGNGTTGFTADQTEKYESQILSGLRRNQVAKSSGKTVKNAMFHSDQRATSSGDITTSTPSGLIAKLSGSSNNYTWEEILLGQNRVDGAEYGMYFPMQNEGETNEVLLEALQSSDLFMVAANDTHLQGFGSGETSLDPPPPNYMKIEDWGLQANVGSEKSIKYNDYSNVMIIKGRKGALYVPGNDEQGSDHKDPDGLVMNSDKWTNADIFACPQGSSKSPDELIILSQWIQNYFEKAADQKGNPYFDKFNTIAQDPNWTGILFLRVDIRTLPTNLVGIMAGVRYPQNFNAHHFAIEISPVHPGDNGPVVQDSSSMFGLIYYEDPYFKGVGDDGKAQPVTPSSGNDYDFCLLSLKVLFENTAVKSFESYAQLTLNKLYGSRVTGMGTTGNSINTVVLNGSLQVTNGQSVYAMGTDSDSSFYLDNNILRKVEVTDVILTTQDDGSKSGNVLTSFDLSGYLDYEIISDTDAGTFDVFSFGNDDGKDETRKGLNYSTLAILMSFTTKAMEQAETENKQVKADYAFDSSGITFDIVKSTPRSNSLYLSLALDLESLVIGNENTDPSKLGYLQVISDIRMSRVSGADWYGLRFQVNMGTPGELAGKAKLTSYMIVAWSSNSTGDSYKAQLGIQLPGTGGGAKLISLQSVMTLSIGQIKLVYNVKHTSFLLMLTEIALKFFGIMKIPPAGSTLFYLFGNPQGGGKPSGLGWYAQYTNVPESNSQNGSLKRLK